MSKLEKYEELYSIMEQAVSKSVEAHGKFDNDLTARLYSIMHEVQDIIDELDKEEETKN